MNYKNGQSLPQPDRINILLEKKIVKDNPLIIDPWISKFNDLKQIIKIQKSISSIDNELKAFKISIDIEKESCPSIDFLKENDVLVFFFDFLQDEWQHSLKLSCLGIIERLILFLKEPLINLISNQLINSFFSLLLDPNLINDGQYPVYSYNITQILKTSCNYSSDFALSLYQADFYSQYSLPFLELYSNQIIRITKLSMNARQNESVFLPNDSSIYASFINIICIFGVWCELNDSIPDNFIENIISDFAKMIKYNNLYMVDKICKVIFHAFEKRGTLISILADNGFFELLWNLIENIKETRFVLEILSYGLICDDQIQGKITSIIKIDIILNKSNQYLQSINEETSADLNKKYEKNLESLIILIANYINSFNYWPSNIQVNDIVKFALKIYIEANYHIKNCLTFLVLQLFQYNDPLQIEKSFSKEFIEMVFDSLQCSNSDVVEKAIDVFEIILDKAIKENTENSDVFNIFIPQYLLVLADDDQNSEINEKSFDLLHRYYPDRLSNNDYE